MGSGCGDPPAFCPAQSRLPGSYLSLPPTNDPLVGNNPEDDTFFGFHANPGYDDWWWRSGNDWLGPYPLGSRAVSVGDLSYAVRQAQPELQTGA